MAQQNQENPTPEKQGGAPSAEDQKRSVWKRLALIGASTGEKIFVGVVVAVIVAVILAKILPNNGTTSTSVEEPPTPEKPPTAIQAKDDAVPDADGLVKEQVWSKSATTFAEPFKGTGAGPDIPRNRYVLVSCKIYWPHPESVSEDGYWYRIETEPWKGLFSPANSYWNGDKPGQEATHSTNFRVKDCGEGELPDG
jgi:hypothetical protein